MKETKFAKLIPFEETLAIAKHNGQIATCPYKPMLTIQTKRPSLIKGKEDEIRVSQKLQYCTSDCAKFNVKEIEDKKMIILSCGAGTVIEYDEIIKPQKQQQQSKKDKKKEAKKKGLMKNLGKK